MNELKEKFNEHTASFWCRMFLRFLAGVVLSIYTVFRIGIPLIDREPLYLDANDGWVMVGAIGILISVEMVRGIYVKYFDKKLK